MDSSIFLQTVVPLLTLIGTGLLSRRLGVMKSGDERVLNAYVYYFALPALFIVELAEKHIVEEVRFMLAGVTPILVVLLIYAILYRVFGFSKNTTYLLILSTVFGSLSFFGIPFITFAFPTERGQYLATLSSASISPISVAISITVLESYRLDRSSVWNGTKRVVRRLSNNPLIISIALGYVLSLARNMDSDPSKHCTTHAGKHHLSCGHLHAWNISIRAEIHEHGQGP